MRFAITNEEYELLDKKFGKLCCKAAWILMSRNQKRNSYMDISDIISETKMHMVKAGMYFKRQTYIIHCLELVKKYCKDKFISCVVDELDWLWENRKHHGANKKKFGDYQEEMLELVLQKYVPKNERPDVNAALVMDKVFSIYLNSIIFNCTKFIGKRFTKDSTMRNTMISMSDNDFLI